MPVIASLTAAVLMAQGAPAERSKSLVQTGRCGAAKAQALLRRAADTSALAEAIRLSGSLNLRVLWPGDRTEVDRSGDRLTVEVDDKNKITRLRCG